MSVRYKLNNWALVSYGSPYSAPELHRQCLLGETEGHPDWEDGHSIVTSRLRRRNGNLVITNSGSCVILGEPRSDYEAQFPDAAKRLMDSLPHSLLEVAK